MQYPIANMTEKQLELPEGMTVNEAADVLGEYHTTDEAQIVSADTLNDLEETVDELAEVFRAALEERTALSSDTISAMPVDALANEFRNDEGEIEPEVLAQNPESGSVETPDDPDSDTLSASEKEEIEQKLEKAEKMDDRTPEYADTLRSEAAEIAGVDSAEDIELEVL